MSTDPAPGVRASRVDLVLIVLTGLVAGAALWGLLLHRPSPLASQGQPTPSGAPLPPTARPSSRAGARDGTALIEVSTPPNLVGPQTVHWVRLDGVEVAAKPLPEDQAVMGAGGSHVLVYRADGHVLDLNQDGSEVDVGQGMPATTARGATTVPVHALASPDGTQWLWGEIVSQPGSSVTSTLTLAGIGTATRVIAQATEDRHALEPYRWALANPLVAHADVGVGGYLLFDEAFGQVDQLNLSSGNQTPVGPAKPEAVDLAGNGARAHIEINPGTTTKLLTVAGPGERGLSATLPSSGEAGGLIFDSTSSHLIFATSPANAPGHEHYETDILDLSSGARSRFGPADLRPAAGSPTAGWSNFAPPPTGTESPGPTWYRSTGPRSRSARTPPSLGLWSSPGPLSTCHRRVLNFPSQDAMGGCPPANSRSIRNGGYACPSSCSTQLTHGRL